MVYALRIYHNTTPLVTTLDSSQLDDTTVAALRAAYRAIRSREPVARSDFDLYLDGATLTYVKDRCTMAALRETFFLHLFPADAADLPASERELGFDYRKYGARLGEACVALVPLPEYALAGLRTGQFVSGQGQLWSVEVPAPAGA